MTYVVDMPTVLPQLQLFSLREWTKEPGDSIAVGDSICVLTVTQNKKIDEMKLSWFQKRKLRKEGPANLGVPQARVRVVALEAGVFTTAEATCGSAVTVGMRLATCDIAGNEGGGSFCVEAYIETPQAQEVGPE